MDSYVWESERFNLKAVAKKVIRAEYPIAIQVGGQVMPINYIRVIIGAEVSITRNGVLLGRIKDPIDEIRLYTNDNEIEKKIEKIKTIDLSECRTIRILKDIEKIADQLPWSVKVVEDYDYEDCWQL